MNKSFLLLLAMIALPIMSLAQDAIDRGYIDVMIEFKSMFPGNMQIRDGVCNPSRGVECDKARIKAMSDSCMQNPSFNECKEARALLDSTSCVEGLIFDGRVGSGDKVKVSVCTSPSGFGNVFVRDSKNGMVWTYYPLLKNGDSISYP